LLIMTKTSAVDVVEREGCLQFGWHGLCKQMLVKP
jgi:hypothetical protein